MKPPKKISELDFEYEHCAIAKGVTRRGSVLAGSDTIRPAFGITLSIHDTACNVCFFLRCVVF